MVKVLRLMIVVVVVAACGLARADSIKLHYNTSQFSSKGGGEFMAYDFEGLIPLPQQGAPVRVDEGSFKGLFQTFCIEKNEFFKPDEEYDWILNTQTLAGGKGGDDPWDRAEYAQGGSNSGDPISPETAYLYTQFWNGTLSSYNYTLGAGRVASAGQLQKTIWYLEDELSSLSSGSQAETWVDEAHTAVDNGSWSGIGDVRVLNLYEEDHAGDVTYARQDQLVIVMPLPVAWKTGLAVLVGLSIIGKISRRTTARAHATFAHGI